MSEIGSTRYGLRNLHRQIARIIQHKYWVYRYGKGLGLSGWQLLRHDLSKLSWTELWESARFYKKDRSPIPLAREAQGYSKAWLHHFHRNPHHCEYWIYRADSQSRPLKMPLERILEMVADWLAANKVYHHDYHDCWKTLLIDQVAWWKSHQDKFWKMLEHHTFDVVNEIMEDLEYEASWQYFYDDDPHGQCYSPLERIRRRQLAKYRQLLERE